MLLALRCREGRVEAEGSASARLGCAADGTPLQQAWARWDWDGEQLRLEVDRYGIYPVFYARLGEGVAVATSMAELLSLDVPRQFDDLAMGAFLRLGFFLQEDTPFKAIRVLPPGGVLTWRVGSFQVVGGPIPRKVDTSIGAREAIDGYITLFKEAMGRSLPAEPERCALPLSGGRDSRHIALELHRRGIRPGLILTQHHFSIRNDDDVPIARTLCDAFGWPHRAVAQVADPLASERERNRVFEGLADEHGWFVPCTREILQSNVDTVYDGIAGDALSQTMFRKFPWAALERRDDLDSAAIGMMDQFGAAVRALRPMLRPELRRWCDDDGADYVRSELKKFAGDENPVNVFMFWTRTRREIGPFMIRYLPGKRILMPYLDEALFDFLWNIPTQSTRDYSFHDLAIADGYPGFATIPYEAKGQKVPDPDAYFSTLMRSIIRHPSFWHRGTVVSRRWLYPRLLRCLADSRAARHGTWFLPTLAYLEGLERLADGYPQQTARQT